MFLYSIFYLIPKYQIIVCLKENLPLKIQVVFGTGAPTARQVRVASFPSKTVKFLGPYSITGWAARKATDGIKTVRNAMNDGENMNE